MDPLAHTLLGAALAKTRLGSDRPLALPTLVLAANVADVDVVAYFWSSDTALAFRRGLTHGPIGLAILPALVAVVVVFGLVTPGVSDAFRDQPTGPRILVAAGLLFPLGLCLGTAFPLGMGAASLRHTELTPWLWGVNGATSVCASVVAVAISLWFGISAAFWTGALCYAAAFAAFAIATRAARPA
jgi:hypothetical protein